MRFGTFSNTVDILNGAFNILKVLKAVSEEY